VAITCLGSAGVTEVDHAAPLMPPALSSLEMLDRVIRSPPIDTGQCGHKTPTKPKSDPLLHIWVCSTEQVSESLARK